MRFATRSIVSAVAVLSFALFAVTAHADTYNFTIGGTGITASGTITVSALTPGVDEITAITGSYLDSNLGGFGGSITGLFAGSYSAAAPTVLGGLPLGLSNDFDNLFYPGGGAASCGGGATGGLLDYCGLMFSVGLNDVNLFGMGPGAYGISDNTPTSFIDINTPINATFTLAAPEAGTLGLALIGVGVVALIAVIRKRKLQILALKTTVGRQPSLSQQSYHQET